MSDRIDYISGSKGGGSSGGGGSQSVTNTPDNLRSKDTVEVILGLGEGPWYGLVNGAKSFYVGDTQLQNDNGNYNFKAFKLDFFPGNDPAGPVVPVLGGITSNHAVNLELGSSVAVTRQTDTGNINYIDVRLAVSRLLKSTQKGTFTTSLILRIEYKALSAGSWTKAFGNDITITGKTTSTYVKEFRIGVTPIEEPYEIRVTKISPENTTTIFTDVSWESYQETLAGSKSYDNTAVLQLVGEASDQFSSIPEWKGIYRGLIVKVPTNYDPITRVYTGAWDGTFKLAWTNNPAWCLYDFVMNDRYGIKSYYPDVNLDKYDTYDAAQWCDELVPNGRGGTQPRYTFNAYLSEPREGKSLARYIAGAFNATFFDDLNGTAYLKVDKDEDAFHIFTKENTYDQEGFEYSYTDLTSRYNDITVTFRNPELNWAEDRRRVYDQALIDKYGRIPLDFIAVGCTDAHEAIRRAHYKLITANTEICMVKFKTNRLGQFLNPFDTILVSDPDMGYGLTGRVKTIEDDGATLVLRDPVYLEAGVSYTINIVLSNGDIHQTSIITNTRGYNYELNLSAPIDPEATPEKTVFTLENTTYAGTPRPFRIMKVDEEDGNPDAYLVEAISINRNKWYDSDNVTDSGVIDYSVLPDPFNPPGPSEVGFEERYIKDEKSFYLTISPFFDRGAYKYYSNDHSFEVWSRLKDATSADEGDEGWVKRDLAFGDTIINHPPGLYEFKVLGRSYLGKTTDLNAASIFTFDVTNPKDPPADIDWAKINKREVYWGYENPPDDFAGFELRYHNQIGRTTWNDAIKPHIGLLSVTSFYTNLIPPSATVIMVRAVDDFGVYSTNSAIIYRDQGDVTLANVVDGKDYHLGIDAWDGTLVGCSVDEGYLKADDTGTNIYAGVGDAYLYDGGLFYEATYEEMYYYDTFNCSVGGDLVVAIDFDGSGYEVNIRPVTSTDDAPWQPIPERLSIEAGDYDISLRVFGGPERGIVREFSLYVDAEDVSEDVEDLVVPSGGTVRVPLQKTYQQIKIVNVIIQDEEGESNAVSYRVLDKNVVDGPEIVLLDANGDPTVGLVDVQIKGF